MKKWSLMLLLWYIFVDNAPWIEDPEKKTVWILKPGWSTEQDCWNVKTKLFEMYIGDRKRYMCIDMGYDNPREVTLDFRSLFDHLRK